MTLSWLYSVNAAKGYMLHRLQVENTYRAERCLAGRHPHPGLSSKSIFRHRRWPAFGTCKGIKHVLWQRERATLLRTDPGSCSGGVSDDVPCSAQAAEGTASQSKTTQGRDEVNDWLAGAAAQASMCPSMSGKLIVVRCVVPLHGSPRAAMRLLQLNHWRRGAPARRQHRHE
jgi:hypothetical protein